MRMTLGLGDVRRKHAAGSTAFAVLGLVALGVLGMLVAAPAMANSHGGGGQTNFTGTIVSLPGTSDFTGDWTVDTTTVHVTSSTEINQDNGPVEVGAMVRVKGTLASDGSVNATMILVLPQASGGHGKPATLCGAITTVPASPFVGDWVVGTTTVHVTATTTLDQTQGSFAVGVTVLVKGTLESDGSITATLVEVLAGGCPATGTGGLDTAYFAVLHLTATADAPTGAEGVAVTRDFLFKGGLDRQDLKVAVEGLLPATDYDVIVDGTTAGVITTDDLGGGQLFLSTANIPGALPLPAALQPVESLLTVSVTDTGGTVMLTGNFTDAKTHDFESPNPDFAAAAVLTSGTPGVVGIALATITGADQKLSVDVWGLTPSADYSIVIDSMALATLTASDTGRLHAVFSSSPEGDEVLLPATFIPVSGLLHVELFDSTSTLIASGDFQTINPAGVNKASPKAIKNRLRH